jgi:hypothetical protein
VDLGEPVTTASNVEACLLPIEGRFARADFPGCAAARAVVRSVSFDVGRAPETTAVRSDALEEAACRLAEVKRGCNGNRREDEFFASAFLAGAFSRTGAREILVTLASCGSAYGLTDAHGIGVVLAPDGPGWRLVRGWEGRPIDGDCTVERLGSAVVLTCDTPWMWSGGATGQSVCITDANTGSQACPVVWEHSQLDPDEDDPLSPPRLVTRGGRTTLELWARGRRLVIASSTWRATPESTRMLGARPLESLSIGVP